VEYLDDEVTVIEKERVTGRHAIERNETMDRLLRAFPLLGLVLILGLLTAPVESGAQAPRSVHKAHVVYVAVGDDITGGHYGEVKQLYPALLAHRLWPGAHWLNAASWNDYDTASALTYELPTALSAHATVVTIFISLVDITERTPVVTYQAELDRLLRAFQRKHIRMFVANIWDERLFPPQSDPASVSLGKAYNAVIPALVTKHGATLVDLFAASNAILSQPTHVKSHKILAKVFYRVIHG
jgi:lysophospholipase L1-like esterase